jgi:hypothetical protein
MVCWPDNERLEPKSQPFCESLVFGEFKSDSAVTLFKDLHTTLYFFDFAHTSPKKARHFPTHGL